MSVTLRNDFHGSTATVRPDAAGRVSARAAKAALRKLCGMSDCECGGIRGRQDVIVDTDYDRDGAGWIISPR